MDEQEKIRKVQGLESLRELGPDKQAELAKVLNPVSFAAGKAVVEEGAKDDCLYFIAEGKVRIEKKIPGEKGDAEKTKELASLGVGDFFGEMALVEAKVRSARVVAVTDCQFFRLDRKDLFAWLESQPQMTVHFFTTLLRTLSQRLRSTSRELTFLYDLASLFLEEHASERVLVIRVVQDLHRILETGSTAAAYLYNEFNEEYELAAADGPAADAVREAPMPSPADVSPGWQDSRTFWAALPGSALPGGYLLVTAANDLGPREREDIARIVQTVARLLVSAMLNIRHQMEENLKARLRSQRV